MVSYKETLKQPKTRSLLDLIGKLEAGSKYNIEYGGGEVPLDKMTIQQVLDHQEAQAKKGAKSTAVGKYQFIRRTLKDIADRNPKDFPKDAYFTPEMQDKAAALLLHRRGYGDLQEGKIDEVEFAKNLSKEWASLPNPETGRSYYDGDGLNKNLTDVSSILKLLTT